MDNIFQVTSSYWAKYSGYEYRKGNDDILYLILTAKAGRFLVHRPSLCRVQSYTDSPNVVLLILIEQPIEETI